MKSLNLPVLQKQSLVIGNGSVANSGMDHSGTDCDVAYSGHLNINLRNVKMNFINQLRKSVRKTWGIPSCLL